MDQRSNQWLSDFSLRRDFLVGDKTTAANGCGVSPTNSTVTLYCSYRFYEVGGGYILPLEEGVTAVTVILHFAELSYTQVGEGIMNVIVEGEVWRSNFDILEATGSQFTLFTLQRVFPVTDGVLMINFESVVGFAKISAIEVHSYTS